MLTEAELSGVLDAAVAAARDRRVAHTVAVVDSGGHLQAFLRMDGALLGGVEVAQNKARTAVYFDTETRNLPAASPLAGPIADAVSFPVTLLPGGIPVRRDGRLIGAVGVGGGRPEDDEAVAQAAAAAGS